MLGSEALRQKGIERNTAKNPTSEAPKRAGQGTVLPGQCSDTDHQYRVVIYSDKSFRMKHCQRDIQ